MEKIINPENLEKVLGDAIEDIKKYNKLVVRLYYYCMDLTINGKEVDYKTLDEQFDMLKTMEKISIFLFSNYTNVLKNFENENLILKAM